uniref:DUF5641 domain-containing protein n=1 Tax=Anopheles atroparvus TaxID=41427 RepID=A0AAG5D1R2_ANOAO
GEAEPNISDITKAEATRSDWKKAQAIVQEYWKRWITEYLPKLSKREKWRDPAKPLAIGDVVTFPDEQRKGRWIKDIICEVFKGKDGQTRSARIKVGKSEITKPTVKLAVLEVRGDKSFRPAEKHISFKGTNDTKTVDHAVKHNTENLHNPRWGKKRSLDIKAIQSRDADLTANSKNKKQKISIRPGHGSAESRFRC